MLWFKRFYTNLIVLFMQLWGKATINPWWGRCCGL